MENIHMNHRMMKLPRALHQHILPSPPTKFFGADATSTTWITESIDLGGYMVLDTACQRSCCGEVWLKTHAKILERHGLRVKMIESSDHFQFGSGKPIAAERPRDYCLGLAFCPLTYFFGKHIPFFGKQNFAGTFGLHY
jgi:hypothetical protein